MTKRGVWTGVCVVTMLVILGGPVVKWVWWPGRAFDPVAWRAVDTDGSRQAMADRLVARRTLIGKTRDEVVQMLGERYGWEQELVYALGPERAFLSFDVEYLHLMFGADGRVRDARIFAH